MGFQDKKNYKPAPLTYLSILTSLWGLVWYWDYSKTANVTDEQRRLGQWIGIAHHVGSDMCYWILTDKYKVIEQMMVQHILSSSLQTAAVKTKFDAFETTVNNLLHTCEVAVNEPNVFYLDDDDVINIHGNNNMTTPTVMEYGDMIQPDKIDIDDERFDKYLNAEIIIDCGGTPIHTHIFKHLQMNEGEPVSVRNHNPHLDTCEYECITDDGILE